MEDLHMESAEDLTSEKPQISVAKYKIGKVASKHLIFEWFSYAGYAKEMAPYLHGACKALKRMLIMNRQVFYFVTDHRPLFDVTHSVQLLQRSITCLRLRFNNFAVPFADIIAFKEVCPLAHIEEFSLKEESIQKRPEYLTLLQARSIRILRADLEKFVGYIKHFPKTLQSLTLEIKEDLDWKTLVSRLNESILRNGLERMGTSL